VTLLLLLLSLMTTTSAELRSNSTGLDVDFFVQHAAQQVV